MRIGIDGHVIEGRYQGSRTFLIEVIRELAQIDSDQEYFLYCHEPDNVRPLIPDERIHLRKFRYRNPLLRIGLDVPSLVKQDKLNIFHSQYIGAPRTGCPQVLSIHDILFESNPELFSPIFRWRSRLLIRRAARSAEAIITGSHWAKGEIVSRYDIPDRRVIVAPYGVDHQRFQPVMGPDICKTRQIIKDRWTLPERFILSVGRLDKRKNFERLHSAYQHIRIDHPDVELVIVGSQDESAAQVRRFAESEGVRLLTDIPDSDLAHIYSLATLFAFPSLGEGFGLPILEAMACGVPVVTSRVGALMEIAKDVAILVDPLDTGELANAIIQVLDNPSRQRSMSRVGIQRATEYSWKDTAEAIQMVYDRVGENPRKGSRRLVDVSQ